jgi:ADP-heptose:LPS heptosyltransferase
MKILLINIKYLGDLIISTPGVNALRKAQPEAEIVFLLRKGFEDVLKGNPNIDKIIAFDPSLKGNSGFKKIIAGIKFIKKIRDEKFDVVIVLHPGDRTAFWAWFSGAKTRIAPYKQSFGSLFNKRVKVSEDSISYLDYYNQIISSFIGKFDSPETEFFIADNVEIWADNFLKENGINGVEKIIGIHPGASEPTKIWPSAKFIELIRKLINNKIQILLIEGPQDKLICEEIKSAFTNDELKYFRSEKISQTAALIKKCNLFITHDTGTRHLSVAVKTPVLALLPEDNLAYWNFYDRVDYHHSLIGKRYIEEKEFGRVGFLDGISVNEVYEKVVGLLEL